jgi:pimeloyl-ACP methyl ester carboxylesterase
MSSALSPAFPTLFLHGGPALSALGERIVHGDALPIHWWDQPRNVAAAPRPFHALVDAACAQAQALAGDGKVRLVGHSFGAVLAHRLSLRMPERIASITLLAPTHELADVFIRLGAYVAQYVDDPAPLGRAIARMQADRHDFAAAQEMFGIVFAVPAFLSAYWSPWAVDERTWFGALMEREPVFDAEAFTAIARDAWAELGPPEASGFAGPVDIVYGNTDVLVDPATSLPPWQRAFRNVSGRTVRSGHFIQIECPAADWWRTLR